MENLKKNWKETFEQWKSQNDQLRAYSGVAFDILGGGFFVAAEKINYTGIFRNINTEEDLNRIIEYISSGKMLDFYASVVDEEEIKDEEDYNRLARLHPDERCVRVPEYLAEKAKELFLEEIRSGQGHVLSDGSYYDPFDQTFFSVKTE